MEFHENCSLTFRVRFVAGFDNDREGFIQLHHSVDGCRTGALVIVRFDFNPSSHFDLYLDGKPVIEGQGTRRPTGPHCLPHLKIGIYRPGDNKATGERSSVMDIDKLRLVDR